MTGKYCQPAAVDQIGRGVCCLPQVPKSGEVWCEGARVCLDPTSAAFNPAAARRFLEFAIEFTPQLYEAPVAAMRTAGFEGYQLHLPNVEAVMLPVELASLVELLEIVFIFLLFTFCFLLFTSYFLLFGDSWWTFAEELLQSR
ncbi:hypothetical protein T492DRAFT_843242 [Pavlovales sp. CCMP2436]|nr:hypothetical protein T492DRAFT_843242 [Pavlovales sp. CCMP2436]